MVLFLFVVMMLNLGAGADAPDDLSPPTWRQLALPLILATALGVATLAAMAASPVSACAKPAGQDVAMLGAALFGKNFLGVKLAAIVLLIGTIGGMHLGRAAAPPVSEEKETRI